MERAICSIVHLGSLKSTPRKPFTCRSMNPGLRSSPPDWFTGSTAEIVLSKVTRTGVPPKVSIPIQFMRALLYTQDSHSAMLASARFCNLIKLLKRAAKLKFSLAIAGAHTLKIDRPSAAAHPGKQISGEVAFRGVRAATLLVNTHWLSRVHRRQPSIAVRYGAADQGKEFLLQLLRDGAAMALADRDAVDGANGRDLRGGSGKEHLVGDVEHLARHDGFNHRDIEILGQTQNAVARDAGQHRGSPEFHAHGNDGRDRNPEYRGILRLPRVSWRSDHPVRGCGGGRRGSGRRSSRQSSPRGHVAFPRADVAHRQGPRRRRRHRYGQAAQAAAHRKRGPGAGRRHG